MKKYVLLFIAISFCFNALAEVDIGKIWNWDHPEQSEIDFLQLSTLEKDPDMQLQLLTQIARAQGLQNKFKEAQTTLDVVKNKLTANTLTAEIRYYLELGRTFNSDNHAQIALPFFQKAFELATTRSNDDLSIDAAHMLGIANEDFNVQVEWDLKALDILKKSSDPEVKGWIFPLYNNMCWSLSDAKKINEALDCFNRYVDLLKANKMEIDQEVLTAILELKTQVGKIN